MWLKRGEACHTVHAVLAQVTIHSSSLAWKEICVTAGDAPDWRAVRVSHQMIAGIHRLGGASADS